VIISKTLDYSADVSQTTVSQTVITYFRQITYTCRQQSSVFSFGHKLPDKVC